MTQAKLVDSTSLSLISRGLRFSRNSQSKSDTVDPDNIGQKDLELIQKIALGSDNTSNHSSVLEHSMIVFDIKCSAKCLLELSRHRVGISMTVTSSRYTLRKVEVEYERTGNSDVDVLMAMTFAGIKELLKSRKNKLDDISMALPASFYYTLQLTFNLRSLVHFLKLRLDKSAHYTIRNVAKDIFYELPEDYKRLLEVVNF